MTTIPDPIEALVRFISSADGIARLVADRVYGGELLPELSREMPTTAIVVKRAGSSEAFGGGYQMFGDIRVDVMAYAPTPYMADEIYRSVYAALKWMERTVVGPCLLHWARQAGGPNPLRDPDGDWPVSLSTWQILVAEVAVR